MSEWANSSLSNHISLITKGTTPTSLGRAFTEKGINFIKVESIKENGEFISSLFAFIDYETNEILKRSQLQVNDILFSIAGVIGRVAIVKNDILPANTNQALAIIRLSNKSEIDNCYLKYFLNSEFVKKQIKRINVQLAQANFSLSELNKLIILYPRDILEQKWIADILTLVDLITLKTESTILKYKAIKHGMLQNLFTRGIEIKTGKLRPRYENAPELYKESKLGCIPKEWIEGKFIDFADEKISHSFTGGPFGSDLQTKHYTNTGVRIIQLQNIGDGYFNDEYKIYTSEEKANQLLSCNIYPGEIIISKMADPIARACIIPNSAKRFLMASDGIRLAIDKKRFNSRYVMETINHKRFRTIAELKSTGSTRARIGLTELKEIPVVYPDKIEQDEIGLRLDTIENKLKTEQNYLQKLQAIKQGLMSDLLSGKKRVKIEKILNIKK